MDKRKYWIAVITKSHVTKGKEWGIIQVCHGKNAPLKRIHKGDLVLFYSPKRYFGDKAPYQRFTAMGRALDDDIYQVEQFEGFEPFRRKMEFLECEETAIRPLIPYLDFIPDQSKWGYPFRNGLIEISEGDFKLISSKMKKEVHH